MIKVLALFSVLFFWIGFAAAEPPVLRLSLEQEPKTLEHNLALGEVDRFLASFTTRTIFRFGNEGALLCDLCSGFKVLDVHGQIIRIEFKNENQWSDKTKLHMKEVLAGLKRGQSTLKGSRFRWVSEGFKEFKVLDSGAGDVLEVRVSDAKKGFLQYLTLPVFSPFKKGAVLGPYELAAWEKGRRIVFEGNPEFKGARPVYRVEFVLGSHATNVEAFRNRKLDILSAPTTEDVLGLRSERVQVNPTWATRFLAVHPKAKKLKEASARRAIAMRLDREQLPMLLKSGERPAGTLAPPGLTGHSLVPALKFDIAASDAELKLAANFLKGEGPNRITLLVQKTSAEEQIGVWLKSRLEKFAALEIDLKVVGEKEFFEAWQKANTDLALMTWGFLGNAQEEVVREFHPWIQGSLSQKSTGFIENEAYVIPLTYPALSYLLGSRVESFSTTPQGYPDLVKIRLK